MYSRELSTLAKAATYRGSRGCSKAPVTAAFTVKDKPCEQVVPEGLANTLAVGLSKDTAPGGTAYNAASSAGWDRPMIGKTGTTQFQGSATFVGATPQLAGVLPPNMLLFP